MRLVFGILVAVSLGCGRPAGPPEEASGVSVDTEAGVVMLPASSRRAAGIEVVPVAEVYRAVGFEAPGVVSVDETRTSRVGAAADGTVVATFAEVGDRVAANAVLAALHSTIVHDAWAAYRKAVAERRQAERELAFAREVEARLARLLRDQAASAQEAERATLDRAAAAERLEMARTEVRRAEETLEHLGITSGDDPSGESGELIPVRTPVTGVVLERRVSTGTVVTVGTPLFVVSDLSSLWVLAEIDETALGQVAVGQRVRVRVAAFPGAELSGEVAAIADIVNPRTRRVTVRCAIPNLEARLKPEMFVRVLFEAGAPRLVLEAPAAAVQDIGGRTAVFVEEAEGRYVLRTVRTGSETNGRTEILEGLQAGDRVVVAGSVLLKAELLGQPGTAAED